MNSRSKYKTKQREKILGYLQSAPGAHITAGDVCDFFRQQGSSVGQATVYRQLESLVDEGFLNKYSIDAGSPACFAYVGQDSHKGGELCFHCKCEKCGRLIHLHCEELNGIRAHLMEEHRFQLNSMRTVFYGLCEVCMEA